MVHLFILSAVAKGAKQSLSRSLALTKEGAPPLQSSLCPSL